MHRTASVNEYSGRYSLMPMTFYTPSNDRLKKQSKTNKQGSDEEGFDASFLSEYNDEIKDLRCKLESHYNWLNGEEVARELSRIDLPLSMYTQWYWKIDLHNLMHFLRLRVDSHAQWEIQQYGRIMAGMFKRVAPLSYQAWLDYNVNSVSLSAAERTALAQLVKTTRTDDGLLLESKEVLKVRMKESETVSQRELDEFVQKLTVPKPVDFELDLSQAKDPEWFEAKMKAASGS